MMWLLKKPENVIPSISNNENYLVSTSQKRLLANLDYLEAEWTSADVIRFIEKVDHVLDLLSQNNIEFISTNYLEVHKVVVTKQITLYYKIKSEKLELLRFWNTYQDFNNFKI